MFISLSSLAFGAGAAAESSHLFMHVMRKELHLSHRDPHGSAHWLTASVLAWEAVAGLLCKLNP